MDHIDINAHTIDALSDALLKNQHRRGVLAPYTSDGAREMAAVFMVFWNEMRARASETPQRYDDRGAAPTPNGSPA